MDDIESQGKWPHIYCTYDVCRTRCVACLCHGIPVSASVCMTHGVAYVHIMFVICKFYQSEYLLI